MMLRLASLTLLLAYITIVLGAATRVFDAGMSCPDWPTCYGVWNPFATIPDGGYVVDGVTYTAYQVALEWGHRLAAALVGFGLVGLTLLAVKNHRHTILALIAAWVLLALQIKLGAWTVWLSNINWSVALHLGNAMLLLAALAWLNRALKAGPGYTVAVPTAFAYRATVLVAAVLVWMTMVVGAFVSSSHAGGVCGGLVSCDGRWLPADVSQLAHMKHRYLALAVMAVSIVLMPVTKRMAITYKASATSFHMMVWGQVAFGIATLYSFSHYPAWYEYLSVAHLAWGTLLWLMAVGMVLNLVYGRAGRWHG